MSKTRFITHDYLVLLRKALNCRYFKAREKATECLPRFFNHRCMEKLKLESETRNPRISANDMLLIKVRLSMLKDERMGRAGRRLHECSFSPVH
jgi:hypothetical protein